MKLRIKGNDDVDLTAFINTFIIKDMLMYVRKSIKSKKLLQFANEFSIKDFVSTLMRRNFLVCRKFGSDYVIEINNNLFMNNSVAKLVDICSLINFGNANCYAYPIFTLMFNYIKKEFYTLYELYGGI